MMCRECSWEFIRLEFPEILFESCASGGGRFDPGMLYYAPQTWTSDNSDAVERIRIQYGTSMVYPLSSMGGGSDDRKDAVMGYYKILNDVVCPYRRLKLHGMDAGMDYIIEGRDGSYSGRELMNAGLITTDASAGQVLNGSETCTDFWSEIYVLHGTKKATGFAIKFGRSDGILFNTGFLFYTVQSPDNYVGRLS